MTQLSDIVPQLDGAPLEAVVSSTWTPLHGVRYKTNLSAAASILLDPNAPIGFWFEIQEYSRLQWTTNNLTINRNGQNINDNAGNFICNVGGQTLRVSKKAVGEWEVSAVAVLSVNPDTALVHLKTITANNDASLDFTDFVDSSKYIGYKVFVSGLFPSVANSSLVLRLTDDGGATWKSGSSDYLSQRWRAYNSTPSASETSGDRLYLTYGVQLGGFGAMLELTIMGMESSTIETSVFGDGQWDDNSVGFHALQLAGQRDAQEVHDGFQLWFSSTGNVASGTASLYGMRKA